MADHVVVETEPCPLEAPSCIPSYLARYGRCYGCLGDGTRVVLDSAIPVVEYMPNRWWPPFESTQPADPQEATE